MKELYAEVEALEQQTMEEDLHKVVDELDVYLPNPQCVALLLWSVHQPSAAVELEQRNSIDLLLDQLTRMLQKNLKKASAFITVDS